MATQRRKKASRGAQRTPLQTRAKATIEIILEATAQILVETGYDGLTTNHVARRAGVSVGSIYQYFRSKEALVAALVDRHLDRLTALIARELAAAVDLPFAAATRRIIGALIDAHLIDPALQRAVIEQVPKVGRLDRVRELDGQVEALLHAALDSRGRELDVADTRLFAFLVVQTTKAVTMAALLEHPAYLRGGRLADELSALFVRYAVSGTRGKKPRVPRR